MHDGRRRSICGAIVALAAMVAAQLFIVATQGARARFNFRKAIELQQDDAAGAGDYQAFLFIKQLKVGGSTMAGVVRQFMHLKWGTRCIEPMRREFTLSGKDGCDSQIYVVWARGALQCSNHV
jgi:hypothetical protein